MNFETIALLAVAVAGAVYVWSRGESAPQWLKTAVSAVVGATGLYAAIKWLSGRSRGSSDLRDGLEGPTGPERPDVSETEPATDVAEELEGVGEDLQEPPDDLEDDLEGMADELRESRGADE